MLSRDERQRLCAALDVSLSTLDPADMATEWLTQAGHYPKHPRPTWRRLIQAMREARLEEEATTIELEHFI